MLPQPQYFHKQAWIATPFKVKNSVANVLKWKRKNQTEHNPAEGPNHRSPRYPQEDPRHNHSLTTLLDQKPATAPEKAYRKLQISENMGQISPLTTKFGMQLTKDDASISRYSNFRTTLGNRRQLLFLKPYLRYRNQSLTIQQKKTEIYRQINHADRQDLRVALNGSIIEYLTEYCQPFPSSRQIQPQSQTRPYRNRASLNVLKEKLKKQGMRVQNQEKFSKIKLY